MITKTTPFYDSKAPRTPIIDDIKQIVKFRFLLGNLIERDLRVRYKRSILGIGWAMVNPLLTMLILAVVFSTLFRFQVENYPVYLLSGLVLWNFFTQSSVMAIRVLLDHNFLLKKIFIPPVLLIFVPIGSALINFLMALVPLLAIAVAFQTPVTWSWLYILVAALQISALSSGVGLTLSVFVLMYTDILDIYQILLNGFFYLCPIIYPPAILPSSLLYFQQFNPMFYVFVHLRVALFEGRFPDLLPALVVTGVCLGIMLTGWLLFNRFRKDIAYYL